jgi:TetR/AcrR family transcriptional repressor of nem operon
MHVELCRLTLMTSGVQHTPELNDQPSEFPHATRDRIVEAARELFFSQGYTATGIAQISKASGARSGSLYHFFPSKEDLLIAVLEKYRDMLGPHVLQPAFDRVSDPIERLFAVLDGYRRLLATTEFQLGCPIGNLALEVSNSHPGARRLIVDNLDGWAGAVHALISEAAGRLPQEIEPAALAKHVLATMEGAVMLARAYRSFEPFDQAVHQLRDYFERLIEDGSEWSSNSTGPLNGETAR